jgi:predicted nucleotidyltransferase
MKQNKISFFYNTTSKEVINTSCDSFDFGEWGIAHAKIFNLPFNHDIHKLNSKTDSKIFKRAIYSEGWSYVNINDDYCFIGTLNLETSKDILSIVTKENSLKNVCLNIEDLNSVFLDDDDIQIFLSTGNFGNHLFNHHLENNIEINKLINELKLLDCSKQTFVFGSVTQGKIVPPDLDIWIDATETPINPKTQDKILKLVEKYSLRLDPYIRTKKTIFSVDSNVFTYEFNWVDLDSTEKNHIVKNFYQWEKEAKKGKPLDSFPLLPVTLEEIFKNNSIGTKLKTQMIRKSKFNM